MIRSLLPFFYLLTKIFKENDRIDKNIGSLGEKRRSKKVVLRLRKQLEEVAMDFCSAITFRLGNSIHKVCTIVHTGRQMICSVERLDLGIGAHSNHYDCDHHHHQHDHLESGDSLPY